MQKVGQDKALEPRKSKPRRNFDSPWKDILGLYFKDFIAYCWPEKFSEIDWSKGHKFLDKELNKISRRVPTKNRIADKLVELYRKNGEATLVWLHLEIQGKSAPDFGERMLISRYRLHDYGKPVASLAILIDESKSWRPSTHRAELWGSYLEVGFSIIKLIDYRARIPELKASTNLFAPVILAQLAALEKQGPEARLLSKIELTRDLYRRGLKKDDILSLYTFIDWVLALPDPLELEYHHAVEQIEGESGMAYVTTAERIGIQKGVQQGRQEGRQEGESTLLLDLLQHKFKTIPEAYRQKVEQANTDTLLVWGKRVLDFQNLEEVFEA